MSDENETRDRQPEGRRPAWQSGTPRGQERVVSYESGERYWTDYLRVALPVVGLLLMLGLLFFWANSIIGDEQGAEPTSTVLTESQVAEAPTLTPENTTEPGLDPTEVVESPTPDGAAGGEGEEDAEPQPTEASGGGDETPAEETEDEPCDSPITRGQIVRVTEDVDEVRFRPEPSTEEGEFPTILAGTELEIRGNCYETVDETNFWNVIMVEDGDNVDAGERGYVADQFLEAVPEE